MTTNSKSQGPSTVDQPTLLERLREETHEVHLALERQLPLTSPDLTLGQYREILERFYIFYSYFEAEVVPLLPAEWSELFASRHKAPALKSDLEFLGSTGSRSAKCPDLPSYASLPKILGALYVIEGSTLGGQLIARHVQQILGLSKDGGVQFFSSYGLEVGSKWTSFRSMLQQYSSPQWDNEIVESAKQTFSALQRCLSDTVGTSAEHSRHHSQVIDGMQSDRHD